MPELPEVQTIVSDLNQHITGYIISGLLIEKGYLVYPSKEHFGRTVLNQEISGTDRIAKNIVIKLKNGNFVHFHLAMTGRILLKEQTENTDLWVKVILKLSKQGTTKQLKFADMRMFGKAEVLTLTELNQLKAKYGPESIDTKLNPKIFLSLLKAKKTSIKNALLDQKVVAGLGNIYATDALFIAKIHPETSTKALDLIHAERLLQAAKSVLTEGINNRGSTLPDKMYVDIFGNPGFHQNHFKVYLHKNCPNCKTAVQVKKVAGRGTYFCPQCQPFI